MHLHDECRRNTFHFISNDNITNGCLWKDGLYFNNDGTYIFASNLVDLNDLIFNRNIWLTQDDNTNLGKENCKQAFLLKLRKVIKLTVATVLQALKRR